MRRFRQQITAEECIEILLNEKRGVLSVSGEGGYPYGIPLNHFYDTTDGKIYFHGAKEGHKIDAIKNNSKVCYTVMDKGYRKEGEWALNIKSVVVFGTIKPVTDTEKAAYICEKLCRKFTDDEEYIRKEVEKHLPRVQCLAITPEHISGKLVNES
ncbi:MAG: pyridoxamine 5'-phosphate oxidase family protein [Clostridia bacterium]|nr:pyridoxamine 5'-phosphate oxidase family protein [Clostridia bacterium]MBR6005360.1 pyridoxamine 5'-phosphate oxidase family protein [Clostridia bacterium]